MHVYSRVLRLGRHASVLLWISALAGCSSISSTRFSKDDQLSDGLVYYLPKRDIKIEVKVEANVVSAVTIGVSDPYADREAGPYVLRYVPGAFGKHKLDVEVAPGGLLKSTKATAEDRIQGLDGLGKLLGYARGFATLENSPAPGSEPKLPGVCSVEGTHTFLFDVDKNEEQLCGTALKVVIESIERPRVKPISARSTGAEHSGIFYRVGKPYRVTVSGRVQATGIVHSPSGSEEFFLPISRTVFATNEGSITMGNGDGIPSRYQQETDGEITSLLKLPAVVMTPYFEAIGSVFTAFSDNATKEAKTRSDLILLELAKKKQEECYLAIRDKDPSRIESLGCAR